MSKFFELCTKLQNSLKCALFADSVTSFQIYMHYNADPDPGGKKVSRYFQIQIFNTAFTNVKVFIQGIVFISTFVPSGSGSASSMRIHIQEFPHNADLCGSETTLLEIEF